VWFEPKRHIVERHRSVWFEPKRHIVERLKSCFVHMKNEGGNRSIYKGENVLSREKKGGKREKETCSIT